MRSLLSIMLKILISLLVLAILQVIQVSPYNLMMSPDHVRIHTEPDTVTFQCTAGVPLTGCQFTWWDWNTSEEGSLLDLSQGNQSLEDYSDMNYITGYKYNSEGLEDGDCRVTLKLKGWKLWMVGCRVRAVGGGWKYAWTDMYATGENRTFLDAILTTPREIVVLPGSEVRVTMKAEEPLHGCSFHLSGARIGAGRHVYFDEGFESTDGSDRHRYRGAGRQSGECGLTLTNVSEADNGPSSCIIDTLKTRERHAKAAARFTAIVVASPPTAPTLNLTYTATTVTARCKVSGSRPIPRMSWILGDDVVRQDGDDDTNWNLEDVWRWPWVTSSFMQNVTLQLGPDNIGRTLKCRIAHVSLAQPLEATEIISSN